MDDEPGKTSIAVRVVCSVLGALFVYVLSVGPAVYFYECSPKLRPALTTIYAPLLAFKDSPLAQPVAIYVRWWEDLARKQEKAVP